jgi:hypothetical protein
LQQSDKDILGVEALQVKAIRREAEVELAVVE